jgi:hypothetical protein
VSLTDLSSVDKDGEQLEGLTWQRIIFDQLSFSNDRLSIDADLLLPAKCPLLCLRWAKYLAALAEERPVWAGRVDVP